jgi:RNA polymerase sigma-70 factor, ECF subfamily
MNDNHLQMIRRAQTGDRQAFAALFEQYKNLVFRSAYLIVDSAEDAEDVLQEVFVHVYKSLSAFDSHKGAFTTWLYRVTFNQCLNHRRKRNQASFHLDEISLKSEFPDAHMANDQAIWRTIHTLSAKQQVVGIMRYYQEFSYAEISQIFEISLGTVKSRLDLAIKTLHMMLENQDFRPYPAREMEIDDEL